MLRINQNPLAKSHRVTQRHQKLLEFIQRPVRPVREHAAGLGLLQDDTVLCSQGATPSVFWHKQQIRRFLNQHGNPEPAEPDRRTFCMQKHQEVREEHGQTKTHRSCSITNIYRTGTAGESPVRGAEMEIKTKLLFLQKPQMIILIFLLVKSKICSWAQVLVRTGPRSEWLFGFTQNLLSHPHGIWTSSDLFHHFIPE